MSDLPLVQMFSQEGSCSARAAKRLDCCHERRNRQQRRVGKSVAPGSQDEAAPKRGYPLPSTTDGGGTTERGCNSEPGTNCGSGKEKRGNSGPRARVSV